jgi:hypothetical protein
VATCPPPPPTHTHTASCSCRSSSVPWLPHLTPLSLLLFCSPIITLSCTTPTHSTNTTVIHTHPLLPPPHPPTHTSTHTTLSGAGGGLHRTHPPTSLTHTHTPAAFPPPPPSRTPPCQELEAAFEALLSSWAAGDLAGAARGALTFAYYWYNFMPLARGTAAVGYTTLLALLWALGTPVTAPIPKDYQVGVGRGWGWGWAWWGWAGWGAGWGWWLHRWGGRGGAGLGRLGLGRGAAGGCIGVGGGGVVVVGWVAVWVA